MRVLLVLAVSSLAGSGVVFAQSQPRGPAPAARAAQPAPRDPAVKPAGTSNAPSQLYRSRDVLPEPASFEEIGPAAVSLPTEPIEPYLLQRQNGPFMVMAHTFRGPDAARYAQALAIELRNRHRMPAYVYYLRFQPGRSNIRDVPPTADETVENGENVQGPARYRSYDEAAVLVGDCKTIDESEDLLKQVKKIRSTVLDGLPSIWSWRKGKGLNRAMLTTNPLVASQELFAGPDRIPAGHAHGSISGDGLAAATVGQSVDPAVLAAGFKPASKPDPLIKQMNSGPNNVSKCAGPYVLEVASFLGRSTTDPDNPTFQNESFLRQSPLAAAADKAEHLATAIGKCKSLESGVRAYVYHDRSSSRVYLGPFASPDDPRLRALLTPGGSGVARIHELSVELLKREFTQLPLAPATQLSLVPQL